MPQHRLSQIAQVPIKEKIAQARKILEDLNIHAWITWVRETSMMRDPALDMIFGEGTLTWQSALIIPRAGIDSGPIAIVGNYDVQRVKDKGFYTEVIGHDQGPKEALQEVVRRLYLEGRKVAVNFSLDAEIADGLTLGMYYLLKDYLLANARIDYVSSAPILSQLRSVKTPSELELMRQAAKEMTDIYHTFVEIFTGERGGGRPRTEKEAARLIQGLIERLGPDSYAWEPELCPSVFTGPNTAEAHYAPTDREIEPGHLLFLDCGVKVGGYCSDLQRTYFIGNAVRNKDDQLVRATEECLPIPGGAYCAFQAIHDAITKAAAAMKPGVLGGDIDAICRGHITGLGYPEYKHATGHGIGLSAHDGVALIAPRWERYGNRPNIPLRAGEVFTLEPRISVPNMGIMTIEEMVVVTPEGGQFLSQRQNSLQYI